MKNLTGERMPRLTRTIRKIALTLGIYNLYEKLLESEVLSADKKPSHVAVILDGNRRWAREEGLPLEEGYKEGARRVEDFLKWCYDAGIKTVTLYALSTENIHRRSQEELQVLLGILREYLKREHERGELIKRKVRVKALGFLDLLPSDIVKELRELEDRTKEFRERFLNVAIAYGGRAEIVEAAKRIAKDVLNRDISIDDIDEKTFEKYLLTAHLPNPYPDLVIRTSGESRISNFLLWQIAYSELVFLDVYWPEFRKIDFYRALRTYQKRSRRYGA
ncbi:MAG: polyprenyl diphosphate synthase [Thermofilaceae archaeon]|nr:polyprenyl diphosphate synthase [Thermofilaceae archaeon]MCX8181292.1 polyprenyl diphosphate synthase [Thermofilaceae archaeon]MDW8004635.1 polyprenyl diphosphate synthase [Thermofilaceae archaeon]